MEQEQGATNAWKSLCLPGRGRDDPFLSCDGLEENETVIHDN